MVLEIIVILVVIVAIVFVISFFYKRWLYRRAVERLEAILFPSGESQIEETVNDINEMTHGRFTREEILDYYLKIKGLQIIDLHSNADNGIRKFLMQPTMVRLTYFEQVKFYEIYLNYPQAVGESII